MFNEAELAECDDEQPEPETKKNNKTNKGRKPLSKTIPRHQVHIDLSDDEKEGAINTFYTKVKEELDIIPAKVRVLEYLQQKAVALPQIVWVNFSDSPLLDKDQGHHNESKLQF